MCHRCKKESQIARECPETQVGCPKKSVEFAEPPADHLRGAGCKKGVDMFVPWIGHRLYSSSSLSLSLARILV